MVSLQKASLIPGGSDSLAYTTLSGIGAMFMLLFFVNVHIDVPDTDVDIDAIAFAFLISICLYQFLSFRITCLPNPRLSGRGTESVHLRCSYSCS